MYILIILHSRRVLIRVLSLPTLLVRLMYHTDVVSNLDELMLVPESNIPQVKWASRNAEEAEGLFKEACEKYHGERKVVSCLIGTTSLWEFPEDTVIQILLTGLYAACHPNTAPAFVIDFGLEDKELEGHIGK